MIIIIAVPSLACIGKRPVSQSRQHTSGILSHQLPVLIGRQPKRPKSTTWTIHSSPNFRLTMASRNDSLRIKRPLVEQIEQQVVSDGDGTVLNFEFRNITNISGMIATIFDPDTLRMLDIIDPEVTDEVVLNNEDH